MTARPTFRGPEYLGWNAPILDRESAREARRHERRHAATVKARTSAREAARDAAAALLDLSCPAPSRTTV